MNVILSLLFVSLLAASSPEQLCVLIGQPSQDSSVSLKDLRNAPTMIAIDNRTLRLSAYPWRNFEPGSVGVDGTGLMVAFKVTSADKQPLPSGIRLERAWILFGEEVWEVSDLRGGNAQNKDTWIKCPNSPVCEISVRGGPKWGPGVYVDVVLRLSGNEGKQYLLQAPHQYVLRTD